MPKRSRKVQNKETEIDIADQYADEFNDSWDKKEKDNIHGFYGSDSHALGVVKTIYSGLPTLDRTLAFRRDTNIYGTPLNKMFEFFGGESTAKTTMSLYWCVQFIKAGGLAYYVDWEHKYDPVWLRTIAIKNGVSEELLKRRFRYVDPLYFEHFIMWLIKLEKKIIKSKNEARKNIADLKKRKRKPNNFDELISQYQRIIDIPFIVVVDSIAAMYTKREKEKEEETDAMVGELANLWNRVLKHIRYYLGYTNCLIVLVNQIRDRIEMNQWLAKRQTSKIKTPCGNAVKFFVDARIQISRIGRIKRTRKGIEYGIGSVHNIKVTKNCMGPPPFMESYQKLLNDRGFFPFYSLMEALKDAGKIRKEGSIYKFKLKEVYEVHESDLDEFADENPKIYNQLESIYRKYMGESNA